MPPCTRSSSKYMGLLARMSRPLSSGGEECCCQGGSLVASMSITLLWVDVWDCASGPSGVASDALLKSESRCSSCVWLLGDYPASPVSAVVPGCCCWSVVVSLWRYAGWCARAL